MANLNCPASAGGRLRSIEVMSNWEIVSVPLADIFYIEVFGRTCVIHRTGGTIRTNRSLIRIERELGDAFLRCHKSYTVNMEHIQKYIQRTEGAFFLLTGRISVSIARDRAKRVKQQFLEWSVRKAKENWRVVDVSALFPAKKRGSFSLSGVHTAAGK